MRKKFQIKQRVPLHFVGTLVTTLYILFMT